jgi:hypothetical protein
MKTLIVPSVYWHHETKIVDLLGHELYRIMTSSYIRHYCIYFVKERKAEGMG